MKAKSVYSRDSGFRNIGVLDAEYPSEYGFNCVQGSVLGTRVPISTPTGGISGSKKLFGHVVAGIQVRDSMPLKPSRYYPKWLRTLQQDFEKTKAKFRRRGCKSRKQSPVDVTPFELPRDPDLGEIILAVQNQRQAEIALRASKESWIQMMLEPRSEVMRSKPYPKLPL